MRTKRVIDVLVLIPVTILAAGLAASVFSGLELNRMERTAYREAGERAVADHAARLRGSLIGTVRALERLAQSWAGPSGIPDAAQRGEAAALVADLPGLLAIAALDPDLELQWVESPLDPAGAAALSFPQAERLAAAGPFDLTDTPTLVTKTIDLASGGKGLRIYVPVLPPSGLSGLVAGVLALPDLFDAARLPNADDGVTFAVFEDWLPILGDAAVLDLVQGAEQGFAANTFASTLSFFGNTWTLVLRPRRTILFGDVYLMPLLVLVLGCLATLAVAGAVYAVLFAWRQSALSARSTQAVADLSQRLKEAEERYGLVAEGARVGLWDWNIRANRLYWTAHIDAMLGIEEPLMAPKSEDFERALHPDDRVRVAEALQAHLSGTGPFNITCRMRCGERPYITVQICGQAIRDADGRPLRMGGSLDDLGADGARHPARGAAPGVPSLPDVVDLVPVRIMVKDDTNRILGLNRHAADRLGVRPEIAEGTSVKALFPDQSEVWHEADLRVFDTEEPSFGVIEPDVSRNGPDRWLRTDRVPYTDPETGQRLILVTSVDVTEDRRAEQALRRSQERYDLVLRGSGAAFWDFDIRKGTMYWSPRLFEITGQDPKTFKPSIERLASLVHPDDRDALLEARTRHLEERAPYDIEFRLHRPDGSYIWLHSRGQAIWDRDGTPVRMLGSLHDISDRKQREAERTALMKISYDGFWDWDFAKNVQYMSPRFWQILGYEPSEKAHEPAEWQALALPEDQKAFQEALRRHVAIGGEDRLSQEMRYRRKDGSLATVLTRGQVIEWGADGQPLRLVATHTDLTPIRRTEAALRRSDERFATAVQGMSVGVWDWADVSQENTWWSPLFFELLGFEPGEVETTVSLFRSLIHPDDVETTFEAVDAHLHRKVPFRVEYRLKHKHQGYRWFLGSGQAIWDEAGKPVRMIGSIMDIHDRKTGELMKSEFVSTVSHELRSPMTSVMGAVGLIRSGRLGALSPKVQELLDIAQANGDRLVQILNDILDMDKIEAGQLDFDLAPHALHGLLAKAKREAEGLALERSVTVLLDPGPDDIWVTVDADRFAQVMANLLSNAIKFSSAGDAVTIASRDQAGRARILVRDQGPGIPPDYHPFVFDKFTQADGSNARQTGGTGLGLSIAKAIVEKFEGTIGFETQTGQGTTFHIDLPKRAPERAPEHAVHEAPPVAAEPLFRDKSGLNRILIVESDMGIVRVLEQLIADVGEVRAVGTRMAARAVIASERPNVIVMDPQLPDGDGLEDPGALVGGEDGPTPRLLIYSSQAIAPSRLPKGARLLTKARASNQDVRNALCALLNRQEDGEAKPGAPDPASRQKTV
ncbi:MAG: PAS domain-containing protein [Alphaproteobacteria bacterium]